MTIRSDRDVINAYYDGQENALRRFAYWSDGVEYVGTCGISLSDVLNRLEDDRDRALDKLAEREGGKKPSMHYIAEKKGIDLSKANDNQAEFDVLTGRPFMSDSGPESEGGDG